MSSVAPWSMVVLGGVGLGLVSPSFAVVPAAHRSADPSSAQDLPAARQVVERSPIHLARSVWQPFNPKGSGFSILMPGTPTASSSVVKVKGIPLNLRQFVASQQNETVIYMAGWLDLPAQELRQFAPAASLDIVQEGFRSRLQGEILHTFDVQLAGSPGRHFKMYAWVDNRFYSVTQRIYLKGDRIYQLTTLVPQWLEFDLAQSVQGFFQSFRLVPR